MSATASTQATPMGPFTSVLAADGAVLACGWTTRLDDLRAVVHPSLRPADVRWTEDSGEVTEAVRRYFAGELAAIDAVPVRQHSGEFLRRAWEVLRTVPPGAPITYTEYAAKAGRPKAVRAAGSACARNAVALIVPCHRVLPAGGAPGDLRRVPPTKRWLLAHEAADCS